MQDISLQNLPPVVVLLGDPAMQGELIPLERYIARRLHWPDEAMALTQLLRDVGRSRDFNEQAAESLEDLLSRRLLALTPDTSRVDQFRQSLNEMLAEARFPAASGPSELTLPVVVVG